MTPDRSTDTNDRSARLRAGAGGAVCRKMTRVTGVNQGAVSCRSRNRRSTPPGHLLGREREQPVVAPVPVDVQVALGVADLGEAELLHHPQARDVLRPDRHLDPVQVELEEAVVGDQRDRGRDHALAGVPLVDPVADLAPARGAADDVGDGELAGERAVDGDRERQRPALAGLAVQVAHQGPERPRARRCPRAARVASHGAQPGRRCGDGPRTRPWRRRHRQRPEPHPAGAQLDPPRATSLSGRSPRSAPPRAAAAGTTTARPSLTPPRDPGRLTTSACPLTPARPRDSAAVGMPLRGAVGPDRLGDARAPRGRAAARVTSGVRSVGVRPVPPVVITTRAPPATASRIAAPTGPRRARPRGRSPRSPRSLERRHDQRAGGVLVDPGRGPVGRRDDGRPHDPRLRDQSPLLPPVLDSTRTSVITARLVDGLDHVDDGERRDRTRRSAPPSRRRCGRWCAPSR